MTFGSGALARNIYDIYHGNEFIPKEWKFIASGSTRSVYLGPDGIVYKLCHDGDYEWNLVERAAAKKWRGSKKLESLETTIPRTALHYGGTVDGERQYVLAMEYVEKAIALDCSYYDGPDDDPCFDCTCRKWGEGRICFGYLCSRLEDLEIYDMFSENLHYGHDRLFHIIDLGCQ